MIGTILDETRSALSSSMSVPPDCFTWRLRQWGKNDKHIKFSFTNIIHIAQIYFWFFLKQTLNHETHFAKRNERHGLMVTILAWHTWRLLFTSLSRNKICLGPEIYLGLNFRVSYLCFCVLSFLGTPPLFK